MVLREKLHFVDLVHSGSGTAKICSGVVIGTDHRLRPGVVVEPLAEEVQLDDGDDTAAGAENTMPLPKTSSASSAVSVEPDTKRTLFFLSSAA